MANVDIKFNNKDYLLSCEDGQEENLKELADHLDSKYSELKKSLGNIRESKIMLITAIKMVDEFFDLNKKVDSKKIEFEEFHILRPSIFLGKRSETRSTEYISKLIMTYLSFLLPWKYKPIHASIIAKTIKCIIMGKNMVNTFGRVRSSLILNNSLFLHAEIFPLFNRLGRMI